MTEIVEGTVICGAVFSRCICCLPPHDSEVAHNCKPNECNGSWRYDENGDFKVVRLPNPDWWKTAPKTIREVHEYDD